jgi:hypothetical protein
MSDPVTAALIGAGIGGVKGLIQGKSPLEQAAMGALLGGGGAYLGGAMGLGGAAGEATGAVAEGAKDVGTSVASNAIGNAGNISMFTPTGVAGIQTMTPALTGLEALGGATGEQAIAQGASLYGAGGTGSEGMFDLANSTLSVNPSSMASSVAGGGGYDPSLLGKLKGYGNDALEYMKNNKMQTAMLGLEGYKALNPPQQNTQAPLLPVKQGNQGSFAVPDFQMAMIPERKKQLYSLLG